jgi:hypothetical protein
MLTEEQERHLQRTLKAAQSAPGPGLEARAMAAMGQAKPGRPSRRLLVASAVGVLALLGFGVARLPMGTASGIIDEMLATAAETSAVHMTGCGVGAEVVVEEWISEDGFSREEWREDDQLLWLDLRSGDFTVHYRLNPDNGEVTARENFIPLREVSVLDESYRQRRMTSSLWPLGGPLDNGRLDLVSESSEMNERGEVVDLVEVEWTPGGRTMMYTYQDGDYIRELVYEEGEPVLIRVEVDPSSGLPLRLEHYTETEAGWQNTYAACYEWNMEIPEELRTFTPPRGTVVECHHWWESRIDQVIAEAATTDWLVTLHSVEVNRHGDIWLSLSRAETADSRMGDAYNSAPPIRVEAVGSGGESYSQLGRYSCYNMGGEGWGVGYWTTTLEAADPDRRPRSVTLTVVPYPEGVSKADSVTFRNVRLPARQDVDDPIAAEVELIEY